MTTHSLLQAGGYGGYRSHIATVPKEVLTMTRQHFKALADEIANISDDTARLAAACAVARVCAKFNSNFNRDRFFAACNVAA